MAARSGWQSETRVIEEVVAIWNIGFSEKLEIGTRRVKNPLYGTLYKRGTPFQRTNFMIIYFYSHTTNTSDVMFKWYGINRVMSNLFKLGIHMDSSAVFIKCQDFCSFDLPKEA